MFLSRYSRAASLLALGTAILAPAVLHAQSTTDGAVGGTVYDAAGAVIPKAQVTIRDTGTNAASSIAADESGNFHSQLLSPGTYAVTVSAPGFSSYEATRVVVTVGSMTTIQPKLTAGSTSQTVQVTEEAVALINSTSPDFSTTLNQQQIEGLPINGRRWSNLALLTPSVTSDSNGFGLLSFRAISPLLNVVQVDGADNNQAFYSEERGRTREGYSTSQASIREFQVNTSNYSAEYGHAAGGVVNSVTKSGTNQIHGELYFYDRDNDWGASNAFTKLSSQTGVNASGFPTYTSQAFKPKDWRKQWGFGVGGPIIKDKLFWFYAYDQYRRNFPGFGVAKNPNVFFAAPSAANLTLLASRLGVNAATAQADYAQGVQGLLSILGQTPRTGDQVINFPKLDWQINDRNHASFQFNRLRWDSPAGLQTGSTVNYGITSFGNDFVKVDWGLARLDTLVSTNIDNQLRYQYGRELNADLPQTPTTAYETPFISRFGFPPSISVDGTNGFTFGTYIALPRPAQPDERKWQIADTVNWVRGNHTFKIGGDYEHNYDLVNNLFEGLGAYSYTSLLNYLSDQLRPAGSQGTCDSKGVAAGNLPCYSSYIQGYGPLGFDLATSDYGIFATDEWKATPRLTLTLGVRYEYEAFPGPITALINPDIPQTSKLNSDGNNIMPRLGFAWDPFEKGRTILRGGYGIFYGRVNNSALYEVLSTTGSSAAQTTIQYRPTTTGAPGFPGVVASTPGSSSGGGSAYYLDPHMQTPQIHQFDLSVEQTLGWNTAFTLNYLGALGRQLPNFVNTNLNTTPYSSTNTGGVIQASFPVVGGPLNGVTIHTPVYNGFANTKYQTITDIRSNINSSYNALVAEVKHQAASNLQFDLNYTWAHALDNNQNQSTFADSNDQYDPTSPNPSIGRANSNFDVRNRFVGYAVYDFESHLSGWKGYLANGWSLSPLVQIQNGLPYSLSIGSSAVGSNFANCTGCFAAETGLNGAGGFPAFIPQIGRNTFNYPMTAVFDLRAEKQFTFAEKYHLQLFGEGFNMLNRQNATGVNTTGYSFGTNAAKQPSLIYNSTFGTISNSNNNYVYSPRQVQISARLIF